MKQETKIFNELVYRNMSSDCLETINNLCKKFKYDMSTILMVFSLGFTEGLEEDYDKFMKDYDEEKRNILGNSEL